MVWLWLGILFGFKWYFCRDLLFICVRVCVWYFAVHYLGIHLWCIQWGFEDIITIAYIIRWARKLSMWICVSDTDRHPVYVCDDNALYSLFHFLFVCIRPQNILIHLWIPKLLLINRWTKEREREREPQHQQHKRTFVSQNIYKYRPICCRWLILPVWIINGNFGIYCITNAQLGNRIL